MSLTNNINKFNDLLNKAYTIGLSKNTTLDGVVSDLDKTVRDQYPLIFKEIILDKNNVEKLKNIKFRISNLNSILHGPKSHFKDTVGSNSKLNKINNNIDSVINKYNEITAGCKKCDITLSEYANFIKKFNYDINSYDKNGDAPLIKAIKKNNLKLVKMLIIAGANIELDSLPLITAITLNKPDIVKLLIDSGASLQEHLSSTPLHIAIKEGNLEMVKILADSGADVNEEHALSLASYLGSKEIVELLIEKGAKINPAEDEQYPPPLVAALSQKHMEIAEFLINHGANVNSIGTYGTPLLAAMEAGITETSLLDKADLVLAKELMRRKFLAHVWGIPGKTHFQENDVAIPLLGVSEVTFNLLQLNKLVSTFFKQTKDLLLSKKDIEIIKKVFSNMFPLKKNSSGRAAQDIRNGLPYAIAGGSTDHLIGILLYKNKLIICDRNKIYDKSNNKAIIMTYDFPAKLVTKDMINNLTKRYWCVEDYYKYIDALTSNLRTFGYGISGQKVGNCSLANTKALFGILCRMIISDENKARKVYKAFTKFMRQASLQDYLAHSTSPDESLLKAVRTKAKKKKIPIQRVSKQ